LRIGRPDPGLVTGVVDDGPGWRGKVCPECRRTFAVLDHVQRGRNEPWTHRRCSPRGGQIAAWVPLSKLNRWLFEAGATFAGWSVTPGVEIEMCVGDLPAGVAAAVSSGNRGLLYGPRGELIDRRNATIGAAS
jgi:hypothetical protein